MQPKVECLSCSADYELVFCGGPAASSVTQGCENFAWLFSYLICDVGEQQQTIVNLLANLPPQGNSRLSTLREQRKQNAHERRAIQKDLKNETRKQKRVYAQASKCTVEELIGLAAVKAAKASGTSDIQV